MTDKSEMTAPDVSVGADTERTSLCTTDSISEAATENKAPEESFEELIVGVQYKLDSRGRKE